MGFSFIIFVRGYGHQAWRLAPYSMETVLSVEFGHANVLHQLVLSAANNSNCCYIECHQSAAISQGLTTTSHTFKLKYSVKPAGTPQQQNGGGGGRGVRPKPPQPWPGSSQSASSNKLRAIDTGQPCTLTTNCWLCRFLFATCKQFDVQCTKVVYCSQLSAINEKWLSSRTEVVPSWLVWGT